LLKGHPKPYLTTIIKGPQFLVKVIKNFLWIGKE